jgi:hypothetical protein
VSDGVSSIRGGVRGSEGSSLVAIAIAVVHSFEQLIVPLLDQTLLPHYVATTSTAITIITVVPLTTAPLTGRTAAPTLAPALAPPSTSSPIAATAEEAAVLPRYVVQ